MAKCGALLIANDKCSVECCGEWVLEGLLWGGRRRGGGLGGLVFCCKVGLG